MAVNKYRALGNTSELVHDKDGFSEVDKALFVGIAQQLGMALKLATRQAIMQTAQEDHVESIVSATSVIAGMMRASLQVSACFCARRATAGCCLAPRSTGEVESGENPNKKAMPRTQRKSLICRFAAGASSLPDGRDVGRGRSARGVAGGVRTRAAVRALHSVRRPGRRRQRLCRRAAVQGGGLGCCSGQGV